MKFYRPTWLTHTSDKGARAPLYSAHFHPLGHRLATGGAGTCTIRIWNAEALREGYEEEEKGPRLLASLTNHDATVLVVRWSNGEGKKLASGADDRVIMIWELDNAGSGSRPFGATMVNTENYRVVKVLRGHDSDVTDLAFSPDNSLLASASTDRSLLLWNPSQSTPLRRLSHNGFVKGLAWDPVGKYLASLADRVLRLWTTTDWTPESTFEKPFAGALDTWFTRLSFSPDGSYLASPSGLVDGLPVSHLLDRSADPPFSPALSLVGHNAPLEFAIFNPRLFPSPNGPISILATASDDGSLSFWSSASPKALFAVEGLVDAVQGVHDGCWDPSGSVFLCVTHGGFANAFEIPELGIPMGKEELDRLLDSYGYRKKGTVAESTRVLEVEQGGLVGEAEEKFGGRLGMGGMVGVASDKGKEKADVEMAEAPPASESMMSAPSVSGGFGVEAVSQAASVPAPAPPAPAPSGPVPPVPMPAPVVQRTKDGKKRIAPTFIRSLTTDEEPPEPAFQLPQFPTASSSLAAAPLPSLPATTSPGPPQSSQQPNADLPTALQPIKPGFYKTAAGEIERIKLSTPEPQSRLAIQLENGTLECRNNGKGPQATCAVRLIRDNRTIWEDTIPSHAVKVAHGGDRTVVSTEEGGLWIWSKAGRRVGPCLVLEGGSWWLGVEGDYAMSLSVLGVVDIWNLQSLQSSLSNLSIAPILTMLSHQHARLVAKNQKLSSTPVNPPKPAITSAVLLPDGTPLILCGTMGAFRYDPGMRGWTRVADPGTLNAATTLIGPQASEVMAAARLREKIAQGVDKMANLAKGKKITAGFIENQLGAARALGSVAEYRYWLRLYAQRLVDEVATEKAQELIDELAGASMVVDTKAVGAGQPAIGTTFDDTTRKILLQDVIPILAKQRAFQRIVTAVVA